MSLLYEAELKGVTPVDLLADLPVEPVEFAADLVRGVGAHEAELDEMIAGFSKDWTVDRMPALDRALLRMGAFELLHRPDVPTGVVLSEAVELAQQFSTDDSPRFVNGLLAAIAREARPED